MKTRNGSIRGQEGGAWSTVEAARLGIRSGECRTGKGETARVDLRSRERGAGKIKAIVVTAILAYAVYAAVKIVPPYAAEYQLADKIQEQARFAVVNR